MEKKTIEAMLRSSSAKFGNTLAMVCGDKHRDYKELCSEIMGLASAFQKQGLKGRKIDLKAELSAEWIIVFLALNVAGAVVILHEPMLDATEYINDIFMKTDAATLYAYERSSELTEEAEEDDTAVIIFTSGTSGRHKGCMLSQKNIISDALLGARMIGEGALKEGDRTIPILPVFHMFGITASFIAPFSIGMTVYIINDIKYVIKSLPEIRPRVLFLVPMIVKTVLSRAKMMLKAGMTHEEIREKAFGGLPLIVSGGAALQPDLIDEYDKFGIELLNGYGITECSPIVTTSSYKNNVRGAVGRVNDLKYAEVRIIDGTIHVSGDIVMKGYCGNETSPFKIIDGQKWFDTLDTGNIAEDGSLFVTGRCSNLIILDDGNNISPEEIELYFEKYDLIESVMVYAKDSTICASVYPCQELIKDKSETELYDAVAMIIDEINQSLPTYKRVRLWKIRKEDFQRTSLRKIIRSGVNCDE